MDASRDATQVFEDAVEPGHHRVELSTHVAQLRGNHRGSGTQLERERDYPLLRPVVQIALDPAASLVGRRDYACPRGGELVAALGVRDRRGDQLGELAYSCLRLLGERRRSGRRGGDHAPQTPLDHDRAAHGRANPELPRFLGDRSQGPRRRTRPAPDRAPLSNHRGNAHPLESEAGDDGQARLDVPAPHGDAGHGAVRLVPLHASEVRTREEADLARDDLEHPREGDTPSATSVATRRSADCWSRRGRAGGARRRLSGAGWANRRLSGPRFRPED
jgi:hypothetical protein